MKLTDLMGRGAFSPIPVPVLALALSTAVAAATPAAAADSAKGAELAAKWCVACHVIGNTPTATIQQGPPSFRAIARSKRTADELRTFLAHPHGAMPDLALSRTEADDLIAYIATLR